VLEDDLPERCLREAFGMFPEGCTCEDNLDCRFCLCVVAVAQRIAREQTGDPSEGSMFVVPVSEDAQVHELRRLFRV